MASSGSPQQYLLAHYERGGPDVRVVSRPRRYDLVLRYTRGSEATAPVQSGRPGLADWECSMTP